MKMTGEEEKEIAPTEVEMPSNRMSYYDEYFGEVVEVLRGQGLIGEQEELMELTIDVEVDEPVRVTQAVAERMDTPAGEDRRYVFAEDGEVPEYETEEETEE